MKRIARVLAGHGVLAAHAGARPPGCRRISRRLIDASPAARTAFWGIQIVDLATGKTLYELNPDHYFVPASNAKLFSTALALTGWGRTSPSRRACWRMHRPMRRAASRRPAAGGRRRSESLRARDSVPHGSGTGNPLAAIEDLADQLVARGVKRVDGDIIGDDTWYVWQPYAVGWAIDDPQSDDGPPISALTVATTMCSRCRCARVRRWASWRRSRCNPPSEFYRIENRVRTVAAGGERRIHFRPHSGQPRRAVVGHDAAARSRAGSADLRSKTRRSSRRRRCAMRWSARRHGVRAPRVREHRYPDEVADLSQAPPSGRRGNRIGAARFGAADRRSADHGEGQPEPACRTAAARGGPGAAQRGQLRGGHGGDEDVSGAKSGSSRRAYNLLRRLRAEPPRPGDAGDRGQAAALHVRFAGARELDFDSAGGRTGRHAEHAFRRSRRRRAGVYAKTGSLSHVSALSGYMQRPDGTLARVFDAGEQLRRPRRRRSAWRHGPHL